MYDQLKKPELLCPVGSRESLTAAVQNGADAVYFGVGAFNARAFAQEFDPKAAIDYAHERGVAVHITFNTMLLEREPPLALQRASEVYALGADALIVQDLGLVRLLRHNFPSLDLHASTQMSVADSEGVRACEGMGFSRVVLARECSMGDIAAIRASSSAELEAFVHGAMCAAISGQCLFSSFIGGRSGNRGACAQPCRQKYSLEGKSGYLLNMKDLNMLESLGALARAGVSSFKVEGRMKRPEYVAAAARAYRFGIDHLGDDDPSALAALEGYNHDLLAVFNRGGSGTGCYYSRDGLVYPARQGHCGVSIGRAARGGVRLDVPVQKGDVLAYRPDDEPEDVSVTLQQDYPAGLAPILPNACGTIYKTACAELLRSLNTDGDGVRMPLELRVDITADAASATAICGDKRAHFTAPGGSPAQNAPLTTQKVADAMGKLGGTAYELANLHVALDDGLFMSAKALNELRRGALEGLLGRREVVDVSIPPIATAKPNTLRLVAQCETVAQARECANAPEVKAIYAKVRILNTADLREWAGFAQHCAKPVYICTPPLLTQGVLESALPQISFFSGAVAGNIGHIAPLGEVFEHVVGDYTLNVANAHSARRVLDMGAEEVTLSCELNCAQASDIAKSVPAQLITYGYLPAMNLSSCPIRQAGGKCAPDCHNGESARYKLEDRLGYSFALMPMNWSEAGACFTQLLNAHPLDGLKLFDKLPRNAAWRICLSNHTPEQTKTVLNQYQNALNAKPFAPQTGATSGALAKGLSSINTAR